MISAPEYVAAHPVDQLTPHPRNARRGNVDVIADSLQAHGQFKPLVVQRQADDGTPFVVCAGNHTLQAAKQIGMEHVSIMVLDINDDEADRILLIDNRANDVSDYDDAALADLLSALAATDAGLAGTGFNDQELVDLLDMLKAPTLDELADEHGDFDPTAVWPVLRFKVSPEDRDRYLALTAGQQGSDADLFRFLLDRAEGKR